MGFFDFGSSEGDVVAAPRPREGKVYRMLQLAAILAIAVAVIIGILGIFKLISLSFSSYGVVFSIGIVGLGGLTALPWVRVVERNDDKRIKITAFVFLGITVVCVILWIVCVWQIVGLINSGIKGAEGEVLDGLISSLNTIRVSIIVSAQFLILSYIAMNFVKYRKTLLPYQIMAAVGYIFIDFYLSLLLTAFTITTKSGFELLPSATILTNKWMLPLFLIAIVLAALPNVVFQRTDKRRAITAVNEALENSARAAELAEKNVAAKNADAESTEEKLNKIKDLLDKGLITQEEYEKKRSDILNSL